MSTTNPALAELDDRLATVRKRIEWVIEQRLDLVTALNAQLNEHKRLDDLAEGYEKLIAAHR